MFAYGLRTRARAAMTLPLWSWPLLAATMALSVILMGGLLGWFYVVQLPLLTLLTPLVLGVMALLAGPDTRRPLTLAAGLSAIGTVVFVSAAMVETQPLVVLAGPFVAITAVVCARHPTAAMAFAFFLTGTFNTLEAFTPIPVGESVDLVLGGLWAATIWSYVVSRRERPLWLWPGVVASLAYVFITFLQALAAESLQAGLYSFRVGAWYMAAVVLLAYGGLGAGRLRQIARGVVLAALAVGGYSVFRWIVGPAGAEQELADAATGTYNVVAGEQRLFGPLPSGHHLGLWTAVTTPFCFALALALKDRWRLIAAAGGLLCGAALFATEVRAGLAGAVAGTAVVLLVYTLSRGFQGPRLGIVAIAIVSAVGIGVAGYSLAIDSPESRERYGRLLTPGEDPAVQRRLEKWDEAIADIRGHPLGLGMGSSGESEKRYSRFVTVSSYDLDNSYLHVATQQGVPIMCLFAAAILLMLYGLVQRGLLGGAREEVGIAIGAAGALTTFAVMMVSGLYVEGLGALAVWMMVGLGVGQFAGRPGPAAPAR